MLSDKTCLNRIYTTRLGVHESGEATESENKSRGEFHDWFSGRMIGAEVGSEERWEVVLSVLYRSNANERQ